MQEILIEYLQRANVFAFDRLGRLTAALSANGFFGEERPPVYEKLFARRARRVLLTRLSLWLRRLIMWEVARWSNADGPVGAAYRFGGRLFFTRTGDLVGTGWSAPYRELASFAASKGSSSQPGLVSVILCIAW